MLNHGDPAVVGLHRTLIRHIVKGHFVEFIFVGVDRGTGIGVIEGAFTFGFGTVTGQLVIDARTNRRRTVVRDHVTHGKTVVTVRKNKLLLNLHAALLGFKGRRRHLDVAL